MGRVAKVFVQNLNAGIIRETDYGYEFSYIEEYLDRKDSVPVSLTLPLSHEIYQSNTLFPFFDGLIPEDTDISYVSDEMKERLKDIIDVRAEVLS